MKGGDMFVPEGELRELLSAPRRIAVLGIKPESYRERPAFFIPAFLQSQGHQVFPLPVAFPEIAAILGQPVFRTLHAIPPPIDIVSILLRPSQVPPYLSELVAAAPRYVWFQSGYVNTVVASELHYHGIRVVHDCILCRAALIGGRDTYPYNVPSSDISDHKHGGA